MLVLYEEKLTQEKIKEYKDKGYRLASIFDRPSIKPGESVGIVVTRLYKTTMDTINNILFRNDSINVVEYKGDTKVTKQSNKKISVLTLLCEGKSYKLTTLTEWKYSHQSEKDQIKTKTDYHPILRMYMDKQNESRQNYHKAKLQEQYELYTSPITDEELDVFLEQHAPQYDIYVPVDKTNRLDKLRFYQQIKWYIDNDIPETNPERLDLDYYGDLEFLEDIIYKNAEE